LHDRLDVLDADEHVFGLEVGVDDLALGVQVVEAEQDLLRDLLDDVLRHAPVLIPLDQTQKVFAEDFKDHADMRAVHALMREVVDQPDDVMPARVAFRGRHDPLKKLDLVLGSLGIVSIGLDDFERHMPTCPSRRKHSILGSRWADSLVISREPYCGEMAPAEFAHDQISPLVEIIPDVDRVIPPWAVVFEIFLLLGHDGCVV
jgi:hypothetical protein